MALGIDGLRIGHWTSPGQVSGCTVILPPAGTLGALAVRGGAPGTREAAALSAQGKITECHAVVLSGGSAYGLATADGVMGWLEERGVGYRVGDAGIVPIVGAAIVLDASVFQPAERPDAQAGRQACEAASDDDPAMGSIGVGTGCTVAKVGGLDYAWRGGIATAVRRVDVGGGRSLTVAAVVANNALGDIIGADGQPVAASRAPADTGRYPMIDRRAMRSASRIDKGATTGAGPAAYSGTAGAGERGSAGPGSGAGQHADTGDIDAGNTVIGCIMTDASLDKPSAARVADLAHSGIARAVEPAHTSLDGDALFCLATGTAEVGDHDAIVDLVATLAADAVADATRQGPRVATTLHGLPGLAQQH
ncbi:MAG: P1 family peptidase [Nitriliruptoraceae bacterium]